MKLGNRKSKAFTLVEFLMVLAVIALLTSIMMPSIQKVKELARRTVCMTNEKGIGVLFSYHLNDFRDYPAHCRDMPEHGLDIYDTTWHVKLAKLYLDAEGVVDAKFPDIYYCPSDTRTGTDDRDGGNFNLKDAPYRYGYGWRYNSCYGMDAIYVSPGAGYYPAGECPTLKIGECTEPDKTVLMADRTNYAIWTFPISAPTYRHNGGANFLFVDLHVSYADEIDVPLMRGTNDPIRWGTIR